MRVGVWRDLMTWMIGRNRTVRCPRSPRESPGPWIHPDTKFRALLEEPGRRRHARHESVTRDWTRQPAETRLATATARRPSSADISTSPSP